VFTSQISTELVPAGTRAIRIFNENDDPFKDPIRCVGLLKPESDTVVELGLAMGVLSLERYLLIAQTAYDLGYRVLKFHRVRNTHTTRWAVKTHSDTQFDYFEADLTRLSEALVHLQHVTAKRKHRHDINGDP